MCVRSQNGNIYILISFHTFEFRVFNIIFYITWHIKLQIEYRFEFDKKKHLKNPDTTLLIIKYRITSLFNMEQYY